LLPKNPIKDILSQGCNPYQISVEAVIQTKDFLEELTRKVAKLAKRRMDEYNALRKSQGLREIRRLPSWITEEITHKVLKQIMDYNMGLQSKEVANPGGENMSADISAKPDKSTNDRREVV